MIGLDGPQISDAYGWVFTHISCIINIHHARSVLLKCIHHNHSIVIRMKPIVSILGILGVVHR